MDYEKKYKEALERAREYYSVNIDNTMDIKARGIMEYLFPELKESEDEKIRKELLTWLQNTEGQVLPMDRYNAALAWLEKQGEQKPSTIDIDKMVDDYANNKERGNEEFGKPVPCMIRAYRQGLNDAIGKVVLKTAWSEEDEEMLRSIIATCELAEADRDSSPARHLLEMQLNWLKSLKTKVQPKQEWSEKDEEELEIAIDTLKESGRYDSAKWVQSLKRRIGGKL